MTATSNTQPLTVDILKRKAIRIRSRKRASFYAYGVTLLTVVLWISSPPFVGFYHKFLGVVITFLTFLPFYLWLKGNKNNFPFMELIGVHYFTIFVPPLFLDRVIFRGAPFVEIKGDTLSATLHLIILGLVCFLVGYYYLSCFRGAILPNFCLKEEKLFKPAFCYLALAILGNVLNLAAPSAFFKFWSILLDAGGLVAVYVLSHLYVARKFNSAEKTLYWIGLSSLVLISIGSGWLNRAAWPLVVYFAAQLEVTRKVPWLKLCGAVLLILFLQAAKEEFRIREWSSGMGTQARGVGQMASKSRAWITEAFQERPATREALVEPTLARIDHLSFFGKVVMDTPTILPYMRGQTYLQIPAMFIPRVIWRNKPSTMSIPYVLALRYEWIPEYLIGKVAVSAGIMDEAYINFGPGGIIVIMLFFGAFIRALVNLFSHSPGWKLVLLGIIFGGGLMITWVSASYFGGIWQTAFVIFLMYYPFRVLRIRTNSPTQIQMVHPSGK